MKEKQTVCKVLQLSRGAGTVFKLLRGVFIYPTVQLSNTHF